MTLDEAFDKGVVDALSGHYKMASIAALYKGLGGFKGLSDARTGGFGNMLKHIKNTWSALSPEQRAAITRTGIGAVAGGAGGLLTRGKDEGVLTTAGRMALGAGLGGTAGHYTPQIRSGATKSYDWLKNLFREAKPEAASVAPAPVAPAPVAPAPVAEIW